MSTATARAAQRLHFNLPPLPYAEDALAPVISAETLALHHGKHHKKYIDTTNELLAKTEIRGSTLEDVVRASQGKLFNNAAQAWNHAFFWNAMSPEGQSPQGELAGALTKAFGNLEALKATFVKAGAEHFGSGWVWLAAEGRTLKVLSTHDADDASPPFEHRDFLPDGILAGKELLRESRIDQADQRRRCRIGRLEVATS